MQRHGMSAHGHVQIDGLRNGEFALGGYESFKAIYPQLLGPPHVPADPRGNWKIGRAHV